ncbi:MAG: PASTA domain-containing protein [Thermoanaerobaculia bacterium]
MKRGCFDNLFFAVLLLVAFGGSTYFWFTFFVKGRSLPTPDLTGKSVAEARALTSDLGVELVVDQSHRRNSDKVPVGHVAWQNRAPGAASFIKRGTSLRVELSAGPLVLRVPSLDGQTRGTAVLRLGQQNLRIADFAYFDSTTPLAAASREPVVIAADPPVGTVVAPQTQVSLLVAVPPTPRPWVMPDLIDKRLDDVRPALERRGLEVTSVRYETYPGIADGVIIRQYPLRGAPVSGRDPITVVVARQEDSSIIESMPVALP